MTRAERWLVGFVLLLLAAFVAEHILILALNARSPVTLDACPGGKR